MRAIEPRGATSVWVPAPTTGHGRVAESRPPNRGFPAMLCWTRPFAVFERYLPAGLALL